MDRSASFTRHPKRVEQGGQLGNRLLVLDAMRMVDTRRRVSCKKVLQRPERIRDPIPQVRRDGQALPMPESIESPLRTVLANGDDDGSVDLRRQFLDAIGGYGGGVGLRPAGDGIRLLIVHVMSLAKKSNSPGTQILPPPSSRSFGPTVTTMYCHRTRPVVWRANSKESFIFTFVSSVHRSQLPSNGGRNFSSRSLMMSSETDDITCPSFHSRKTIAAAGGVT